MTPPLETLTLENHQQIATSTASGECGTYRVHAPAGTLVYVTGSVPTFVRLPSADEIYERERVAFLAMPPDKKRPHLNRWVAVYRGEIVAIGDSDSEVLREFVRRFGDDAQAFIGFVGDERPAYQIPPRR